MGGGRTVGLLGHSEAGREGFGQVIHGDSVKPNTSKVMYSIFPLFPLSPETTEGACNTAVGAYIVRACGR